MSFANYADPAHARSNADALTFTDLHHGQKSTTGTTELNTLADAWDLDLATPAEYRAACDRLAQWKKFAATWHTPNLGDMLDAATGPEEWATVIEDYAVAKAQRDALDTVSGYHDYGRTLATRIILEFNSDAFLDDILAQLPIEEVAEEFTTHARTLGPDAWHHKKAMTTHGATGMEFYRAGAKLHTLAHLAGGLTGSGVSAPQRPMLAMFADPGTITPLTQERDAIATRTTATAADVQRHKILSDARKQSADFGDLVTRLAQGAFPGVEFAPATDTATIRARAAELANINQYEVTDVDRVKGRGNHTGYTFMA